MGIILRKVWVMDSLSKFFAAVIIFTVVFAVSMWCLGMNEQEKDMVLGPLKRIYKRSRS